MGLHLLRGGSVMFGDLAMRPKENRLVLCRDLCLADQALNRLHLYPRDVGNVSHACLLYTELSLCKLPYPKTGYANKKKAGAPREKDPG